MPYVYKGGTELMQEIRETDVAYGDIAHFVEYLFRMYRAQKFHMLAPEERFIYAK